MRPPRLIRDLLYMAPFACLLGLVYLFAQWEVLSGALSVALSLILLIIAVLAGFLRYASLRSVAILILVCVPFFVFLFALIYAELGIIPSAGGEASELDYLYFSVVTFTTLGYGDFAPSEAARLFAALEALLGYVILGVFVSVIIVLGQRREETTVREPAPPSRPDKGKTPEPPTLDLTFGRKG